ncbi:MAG: phage tail tape measure protein [Bacteroidales bacterium]|nr:phage tail tape measure protein [Bacteroidales bacterium]
MFNLIGHDKTGPATKSAASNLDHVSKSATNMGKVFAGVAAGAGLAVLGKQAMDFAKDSVAAFTTVGKEAGSLQRVMGGTIEEASSMRGMFKLAGVDAEQAGKSMGLFSKSIVNNADAFAGMGVAVRDAGGQIRPTNDILKDTAERFKSMPNGAEKTALAMELFGKSGAAMLPFLNRGAEGLTELEKKTAEYGLTLTKVDQEAIGGAIKAQRELDMAMEGAKVTLGAGLAPLFTEAKTAMAEMAVPLTQALLPGFEAIGDVAMLALTQIRDNMPAVEAGVERFAGFLRDASTVVQDNWPQIVETVEGLAGALQRVSGFAGAMWDAFLPCPRRLSRRWRPWPCWTPRALST